MLNQPIDMHELNTMRMLVFIETGVGTCEYQQVLLNSEQFKKVSQALADAFGATPTEGTVQMIPLRASESVIELPDEFVDVYDEKN